MGRGIEVHACGNTNSIIYRSHNVLFEAQQDSCLQRPCKGIEAMPRSLLRQVSLRDSRDELIYSNE